MAKRVATLRERLDRMDKVRPTRPAPLLCLPFRPRGKREMRGRSEPGDPQCRGKEGRKGD